MWRVNGVDLTSNARAQLNMRIMRLSTRIANLRMLMDSPLPVFLKISSKAGLSRVFKMRVRPVLLAMDNTSVPMYQGQEISNMH